MTPYNSYGKYQWISTTQYDAPVPKDGERVLIWYLDRMDGPRVEIGRYLHILNEWRPVGGTGDFSDSITHWMPLPTCPATEQGEGK